jgi:3-hydroxybutyryl-CoA dehydratase
MGDWMMFDSEAFGDVKRGTICIEDLSVGMSRGLRKVIEDVDLEMFARISGDRNPVHFDDDYARDTIFGGRIAHGMLTASLISAVIGEQLPGHGTIYLKQNLSFLAPVRPGDLVEATVTVQEIDYAKRRVTLACVCVVAGKPVLKGEAMVLAPSAKFD